MTWKNDVWSTSVISVHSKPFLDTWKKEKKDSMKSMDKFVWEKYFNMTRALWPADDNHLHDGLVYETDSFFFTKNGIFSILVDSNCLGNEREIINEILVKLIFEARSNSEFLKVLIWACWSTWYLHVTQPATVAKGAKLEYNQLETSHLEPYMVDMGDFYF